MSDWSTAKSAQSLDGKIINLCFRMQFFAGTVVNRNMPDVSPQANTCLLWRTAEKIAEAGAECL